LYANFQKRSPESAASGGLVDVNRESFVHPVGNQEATRPRRPVEEKAPEPKGYVLLLVHLVQRVFGSTPGRKVAPDIPQQAGCRSRRNACIPEPPRPACTRAGDRATPTVDAARKNEELSSECDTHSSRVVAPVLDRIEPCVPASPLLGKYSTLLVTDPSTHSSSAGRA
jgi:hypothetical protein